MPFFATAGSKVYIGGTKSMQSADFVASDFNAESWIEIKSLETIGTVGDTANAVTFAEIGDARQKTLKGLRVAEPMSLVAAINYDDAGQLAALAAAQTNYDYSFRIQFNDAPPGGTPSYRYFIAKVMSASEALDGADNVMKVTFNLAVNSNVVRVSAAASGSAPDNTSVPTISGTAETGQTLTAGNGTWTGTPTPSFSYQWLRDGESIAGATESTYVVVEADEGAKLRVQVTATNVNGVVSALSAETATVTDGS